MLCAFDEVRRLRGDGSVVTQLMTCCTAVDPIVASGLVPRYGDVSTRTLSLDPETLPLPADVRAVMLQHTLGLMDPGADARLAALAHEAGAIVVEDCAHCVGRISRDASGEPVADLSVHSFGVEKMLPTKFGGAVWVNPAMADAELRSAIVASLGALPVIDEKIVRATQRYRNQIRVLNHLPRKLSHVLRVRWARSGFFEPAITTEEMAGEVSHAPMAPDESVAGRCLEGLAGIDAVEAQKAAASARYAEVLAGEGDVLVPEAALDAVRARPLLFFPVYVDSPEQADAALAAVRASGHYCVSWYRPLLYPGVSAPEAYAWDGTTAGLSQTERLSHGPVCLPTDVDPDEAERVAGMALAAARDR